jgi:hypothetical protein
MTPQTHLAAAYFGRIVLLGLLLAPPAFSQVRQIDRAELPQTSAVQNAYTSLLAIDQYARFPVANWSYPVTREQVANHLQVALHTLQRAQLIDIDNKDLQILTGLVAHLAYNMDVQEGRDVAVAMLDPLAKEDFRADWFLGMQQCESNDPAPGMQRLLHIESSTKPIPGDFWQDYAYCAGVTNLPVHAIRAYDAAKQSPDKPAIDEQLEQAARDRIKPSSTIVSYPAKQAWYTQKSAGTTRYTSNICGASFATKFTFHLNINEVAHGTCSISIDTEQYPSRFGPSSASLLLLAQAARPHESLQSFAQRILAGFAQGMVKDPLHVSPAPLPGIPCPVASCLFFEIINKKQYKAEGGAHLLGVFFESDSPDYPGLRFESPQPQPKVSNNPGQPAVAQPEPIVQRLDGPLYFFISLDSNEDIFPRARLDFQDLLKSLVVDSK